MEKRKSPATNRELLRVLVDLFNEVSPDSVEEAEVVLRQAGYDPDRFADWMRFIAKDALLKAKVDCGDR